MPYEGTITIDGLNAAKQGKAVRHLIGFVPQELTFHDDMTVTETMEFYALLRKLGYDHDYSNLSEGKAIPHGIYDLQRNEGYISIGGTAPVDSSGQTVGVGDPAMQARRCLEIIKEALENAGSSMEDVVRTRVILTNIDDWKSVVDVRAEYFREIRPVDTIMEVSRFVNPEWLVEFEADAVMSDGSEPTIVGP